jgi:hypothetical protein
MTRTTLCVPYPITPGPGLKAADRCLSYVSQIMVKDGQTFISASAPGTTGAPRFAGDFELTSQGDKQQIYAQSKMVQYDCTC